MAENLAGKVGSLEARAESAKTNIAKLFDNDAALKDEIHKLSLNMEEIPHIVDATDRMVASMDKLQNGIDKIQSSVDRLDERVDKLDERVEGIEKEPVDYVIILKWFGGLLTNKYFLILAIIVVLSWSGVDVIEFYRKLDP